MRGLVLEGGGIKGSYQIGAFYALYKCGIKFNGYAGTSIGSFNSAVLACGKHKELLNFWYNLDLPYLLGLNEQFIDDYNGNRKSMKTMKEALGEVGEVIKNHGIQYEGLMAAANKIIRYDDLIKNDKDFGLVTVQINKGKFIPKYVLKKDIKNQEELIEYIMASCYFPGIKQRRIIDNHYYIDGGFYDNSPVKIFLDKGYNEVYVVNVKGIGFYRKIKDSNAKIINIKPSRKNGMIFELDKSVIRDNIMMGYYDTLRVIKQLDGYKYCFKKKDKHYYDFITRKVNKRLLIRVMNFFGTKSVKIACIKAMEYVLERDKVSYYDVYDIIKLSKKYRKKEYKHFIYRFVQELRFFF